jgi:ABC-type multidrug transport system fused ATPase/permease subunit
MDELAKRFPPGLKYDIVYNPTEFIQQSVDAVQSTIGEAIILVVLVVILFLQTWRAAIIPIVAIPVSLIGTFFFMALFGFTLNNLSLFGLVLAIGIVVDDAIVVVENVERNYRGRPLAARRVREKHGRSGRRADRDRAGAHRRVRADRVHHRHFGQFYRPVRAHHRRRDLHLADRFAHALAGALRAAAQAQAPDGRRGTGGASRSAASLLSSTAISTSSPAATAGCRASSCASRC